VRARSLLLAISAGVVLSVSTSGQAQNTVALTGKVSAAGEAAMEGVLVSAKRDGSTITTTVATNAEGIYSFPAERLAPGRYTLSIRAIGYRLDGPKSVELGQQAATTDAAKADLTLVKAKALANQLSNAEWLEVCRATKS